MDQPYPLPPDAGVYLYHQTFLQPLLESTICVFPAFAVNPRSLPFFFLSFSRYVRLPPGPALIYVSDFPPRLQSESTCPPFQNNRKRAHLLFPVSFSMLFLFQSGFNQRILYVPPSLPSQVWSRFLASSFLLSRPSRKRAVPITPFYGHAVTSC